MALVRHTGYHNLVNSDTCIAMTVTVTCTRHHR